ncbi:MAG: F0F1 ATP synthase subunit A [Planctomycetes bacterium]|nr:F0F1 ATP synthase subunit A [Planctomycetota bacterium]
MLARFLITAWLCLLACVGTDSSLPAQGGHESGGASHATSPEGHGQEAGHGGHAQKLTLEMSNSEIFKTQFSHSVPYAIFPAHAEPGHDLPWYTVYNIQPWQWISLGLLLVLFVPVIGSFKSGRASWLTRVMRGFCLWVRDDLVYAVMGKEVGRPFVPFFMFMFFFLVTQNVIGLVPALGHSFPLAAYTATGTPYVTGAMAVITLLMMLGLGMKKNGALGFWKGLLPHGLPLPLIPLMFLIEFASLLVKPFALTIRLFANMLAGHLVIASAIGLVFLFAKLVGGTALAYVTALPCVGMAIFIYIIEAFVTLLQAYIFTLLSVTFVYQAIHQEH